MFGINGIWLLLVFPFIGTIWCVVWHKNATKWWELLVIWAVPIVVIVSAQAIVERVSVADTEHWGYNGEFAVYDEPFQYWDRCSKQVPCGTYNCGTAKQPRSCTKYCTEWYDCKEWGGNDAYLQDQSGNKRHISPAKFKQLEGQQWSNSQFIELNRQNKYRIIVDGDRRVTKWPKTWETAEPISEEHTYENRTICSTTMQFQKITDDDKKRFGLFDYPTYSGGYEVQTIIDQNGKYWKDADQKWRYLNGVLGPYKRVRLWVLVFRDKPIEAFYKQQGYWYNGNKNEFIVCIGADKEGNIKWGEVMSWTEVEDLKIDVRNYVSVNMKTVNDASLQTLASYVHAEVGQRFIKPEFTAKFKHLAIKPSTTSMVTCSIIVMLVTLGVCYWVIKNDFHDSAPGISSAGQKWMYANDIGSSQRDMPRKPSQRRMRPIAPPPSLRGRK